MKIHLLNKSYINEILKIETETFSNTSWSKQTFLNEFSSPISYIYGIIDDNQLIGYMIIHIIKPEAHILNFAIAKKFQNKGYGSKLLNYVINNIKKYDVKSIFLEVSIANKRAQHLYKKFGFKKIYVRKNYYKNNNEDALVMALYI